ncbi:MAG: hypothetical protein MUF49_18750 [Oculatellaceae cyanobacterium Prado106]|jgi:predicted tellurium resistance membrane protein TerC|nr:hypothetical protein [Oculatellaceae cyanobacterium Prado106]
MNSAIGLVAKVFLISIGFSFLIKEFAPQLPFSATNTTAWIAVLLPSLVMALLLLWRGQRAQSPNAEERHP